ncbi:hypothetical protein Ddc_21616 [Ditylenchus destructor]|nr:hypothetical protein Ddc_21616 [Ditylenchus destructor]
MALSSNKLNVLPVICIIILTICWQAHAPETDPLSEFGLEHIERIEKLDFSKIPEQENVTKLIRILKEMKTINHSGTDLEKVKRAQSIWHEAEAIFQQFNLTGNGPHAKPNEELVTELKSLVNEIDSKSESDIVAKVDKLRVTLSAFKQKLGLSSKAVSAAGIPKGNAPGQAIQPGAEKAQPEINESELKKSLAVALETFSGYINRYFTKTIERLEKDSGNPRRRRKRSLFSKIQ